MVKIEPIVFTPQEPIIIGEGDKAQTFEKLTFSRKMKGKDLVLMDLVTGEVRKGFAMFASMAGVPITVFDEMDFDDFERLAREVAPLMGKRGKTVVKAIDVARKPDNQPDGAL